MATVPEDHHLSSSGESSDIIRENIPDCEAEGKFVEKVVLEEDTTVLGPKQKRNVNLWLTDALMLLLEHLQRYALILSISLGWAWPQVWISGSSFAFLFNLDLWEFTKVHTVYVGQQQAFIDPSLVPFSYLGLSIYWILAITLAVFISILAYVMIPKLPFSGVVYNVLLRARLVRLFILISQALCLPFGLVVVRLFDCQNYPSGSNGELLFQSVVLSDTLCWNSAHLGVLVPLLVIAVAYFILIPCWMIYTIRKQLIFPWICTSGVSRKHESMVQLKEAEYLHGLDIAWETKYYPLFSSYRRAWVWFRPFSYFVKGVLLITYGSLFYVQSYQTIVIFGLVCFMILLIATLPVYRLHSFNFMLIFSNFVNLCNLVLGVLLVLRVQNSLLVGINLLNALIVINVIWVLVALIWFGYLVISNLSVFKKEYGPFWPTLTELNWSSEWKSDHTTKYYKAILAGRKVLEKSYFSPTLFAPVHELSKHIQIMNAYCREAELLTDRIHDSLWALTTEMVDVYNHLLPLSMFAASMADKVSPHIEQLLHLVPAFTKRLEKRDYDFALWSPRKRRVLLKLLALATFLEAARKSEQRPSSGSSLSEYCNEGVPAALEAGRPTNKYNVRFATLASTEEIESRSTSCYDIENAN